MDKSRLAELTVADVVFVDPVVITAIRGAHIDYVGVCGEGHDLCVLTILGIGAKVFLPFSIVRISYPLGQINLVAVEIHFRLCPDLALQIGLVAKEVFGPLLDPLRGAGIDVDSIDVAVGLDPIILDQDVLRIERK